MKVKVAKEKKECRQNKCWTVISAKNFWHNRMEISKMVCKLSDLYIYIFSSLNYNLFHLNYLYLEFTYNLIFHKITVYKSNLLKKLKIGVGFKKSLNYNN